MPVRQWVLIWVMRLPIPLRLLLAAQPKLVTPMLQVMHGVITQHLLSQAALKPDKADSGAVTPIQRFGSAANLNIHLHCLVLDGVYRRGADGTLGSETGNGRLPRVELLRKLHDERKHDSLAALREGITRDATDACQ